MQKKMLLLALFCSLLSMGEIFINGIDIQYQANENGFLISFDKKYRVYVKTSQEPFLLSSKKMEGKNQNSCLLVMNDDKLCGSSYDRHCSIRFFTSSSFIDFTLPDSLVKLLDELKKSTSHFLFYRTSFEMRSFGKSNVGRYYLILPPTKEALQFLGSHPQIRVEKEKGFLIIRFAKRELDGYNNAYIVPMPDDESYNDCPIELVARTKYTSYGIGAPIPLYLQAQSRQPLKSLEYRIDAPDGVLADVTVTNPDGNRLASVPDKRIHFRSSNKWTALGQTSSLLEDTDLAEFFSDTHATPKAHGITKPGTYHVSLTVKMAVRVSGSEETLWDGIVVMEPLAFSITEAIGDK